MKKITSYLPLKIFSSMYLQFCIAFTTITLLKAIFMSGSMQEHFQQTLLTTLAIVFIYTIVFHWKNLKTFVSQEIKDPLSSNG